MTPGWWSWQEYHHTRTTESFGAKRGRRSRQTFNAAAARQIQVRLSPDDIERLVRGVSGWTSDHTLAAEFSVHRNTVQRLLRTQGLVLFRKACPASRKRPCDAWC
jgi:hypothetical protein